MKKNLLGISLITMSCLYGILAAIIILIFLLTDLPVIYGIIISIVILLLQFLLSPILTDLSMKWFYKAKFDCEIPDYLKKFIENVCSEHNMKYPKIGYIDDGAPNAFTYGRTKNDARIILTRGIFDLLNEEEVKAVVAHELGHATHYDMLFMTSAQLVPLVLYAVYETFVTKDNDSDNSNLAIVGIIAYILYIISQYIVLWLSRTREYYADSFAIEKTKNPNSLAEALVKIGYGLSTSSKSKHSASKSNALGIFDTKTSKSLVVSSYDNGQVSKESIKGAMKWERWNIWAKVYELNSTHPLISKRLTAISSKCKEYNQQPYIEFDLKKQESYVDDFLIELLICLLPVIFLASTIILALVFKEHIFAIIGLGGILFVLSLFIELNKTHKNKNYKKTNVANLLSEVKVSSVTSIPCVLEGTIIGRGNPGCIFNEDFVIKDETGIIFLDYNQPLMVINKIFALFKSKEYFDKKVVVTGWYRRSPVPYVEVYSIKIDGKVKKCHTYKFTKIIYVVMLIVFISVLIYGIF